MAEVPEQGDRSVVQDTSRCSGAESDTMDAGVAVEEFINTGRTGRRNAVADLSDPHVGTISAAGMDFSFDKLSVSDPKCPSSEASKTASSPSSQSDHAGKS